MPFLLFTGVRKHHGDKTNLWDLSVLLLSKTVATLENWNQRLPEITEQLILGPFLSIISRLYSLNSKIINAELLQAVWALIWVSNESCHGWKLRALLAWQHPTIFRMMLSELFTIQSKLLTLRGANPPSAPEKRFHTHGSKRHYFRFIPCWTRKIIWPNEK